MNRLLDELLAPVNEANEALELVANFDLRARVGGVFQGDHNRLKDALNQTGDVLHNAMRQVSEAAQQILSASAPIASTSQVNTTISSIDKVTQANASASEESSSAAEELAAQARELVTMVSRFELEGDGHGGRRADGPTHWGRSTDTGAMTTRR